MRICLIKIARENHKQLTGAPFVSQGDAQLFNEANAPPGTLNRGSHASTHLVGTQCTISPMLKDHTAFMMAPSMTTPAVTYFQSAISSFRAALRSPFCATGRRCARPVPGTNDSTPSLADDATRAKRAGLMLFAVLDFQLSIRLVLDRSIRSARALAPGRHKLQPAACCQSAGIIPLTREWRQIQDRYP